MIGWAPGEHTFRDSVREVVETVAFNTLVALFLRLVGIGSSFGQVFVISQCIGLAVCGCLQVILSLSGREVPLYRIAGGLMVGSAAGLALGAYLTSTDVLEGGASGLLPRALLFGVIFGAVAYAFFISRQRILETGSELQEERIRAMDAEKRLLEARLKLLQAQIEPHFLFNTLANVHALIETDPPRARAMLDRLSGYLRGALDRTREGNTTLGQELELVGAYLEISALRMGRRLRYHIDVPGELLARPFPPMLLQPLVENAVTHGLEPQIDGGEVRVAGELRDGRLRLAVCDTGGGMGTTNGTGAGTGTGLTNIRGRLELLFGDRARLTLAENPPSGVCASLEVPDA